MSVVEIQIEDTKRRAKTPVGSSSYLFVERRSAGAYVIGYCRNIYEWAATQRDPAHRYMLILRCPRVTGARSLYFQLREQLKEIKRQPASPFDIYLTDANTLAKVLGKVGSAEAEIFRGLPDLMAR